MKIIRNLKQLCSQLSLADTHGEETAVQQVLAQHPFAITQEMANAINGNDPNDPIRRQFVPDTQELTSLNWGKADPIGDHQHSPVTGIVHRHSNRCLFMPIQACPVYCRFCFRRGDIGPNQGQLNATNIETALNYIRTHQEIWEVIFTGGDPLMINPKQLSKLITELKTIKHIKVLRFHTRVPIVAPALINEALLSALQLFPTSYIVIHTNHVNELTPNAKLACQKLTQQTIPLLSQTVLLKGINDSVNALGDLFKCLVEMKIKPYYLHHLDLTPGTQHFHTTIENGKQLMRDLRATLSGLCLPTYVLDIPGGYGKIPVGEDYVECLSPHHYQITDYHGHLHLYNDRS